MMRNTAGYSGFDYGIVIGPDGEKTDKISCFPSTVDRCIVIREPKPGFSDVFLSPARESSFHDTALRAATRKLNAAVAEVLEAANTEKRALHLLKTDAGLMWAWVEESVIDDDGL